jgi:hypothetical protein
MRKLTQHIVEGDTAPQLSIDVLDEPGQGGANHKYRISWSDDLSVKSMTVVHIPFQNGPIKEFGINGITQEALLVIVIDRLQSFQAGPFACESNQKALDYAMLSLSFLQDRTRDRIKRQVEGTNQK